MPPAGETPVRLVVQYLGKGQPEPYRVIVYPDRAAFRTPRCFTTRDELIRRLRAILPRLDGAVLEPNSGISPQIVFAESVELSDAQLAELWGK
jgi:hypothetical protein